eukprot:4187006-Heterocapsa_arctica.AAC.1
MSIRSGECSQKSRMSVRNRECQSEVENVSQNVIMSIRARQCEPEVENVSEESRNKLRKSH